METYCIIGLEDMIHEALYIDYLVSITDCTYMEMQLVIKKTKANRVGVTQFSTRALLV